MNFKFQKILIILSLFAFFISHAANQVKVIRSNSMDDKVQIVLDMTSHPSFKVFSIKNPNRVVIDILATPATSYKNRLSFKNRGVLNVRTGMRSDHEIRVVLDLKKDYQWQAYALKPDAGKGNRIVIDVYDQKKMSAVEFKQLSRSKIKLESVTPKQPVKEIKRPVVSPPSQSVAQKVPKNNRKVVKEKSITQTEQPKKDKKVTKEKDLTVTSTPIKHHKEILIMIDPGHGGKDPGAHGAKGTREKDVVLSIAKRLKKKIDAMPNMRAILTRSTDRYITLRGRLALARRAEVDLFVSIHADAFRDQAAKGSSVFILSNRGASSEAARLLAQSENSVDLKYGVDIGDYDKDISNVLMQIQQDATIESSYILGKKTLYQMKRLGPLHKGSVERAGFAVLKSPDIPSMLVETAFISNPEEEKKLNSAQYQDKLATAIAEGIRNYFNEYLPYHLLLIDQPSS